jgi:hypothetical protein
LACDYGIWFIADYDGYHIGLLLAGLLIALLFGFQEKRAG